MGESTISCTISYTPGSGTGTLVSIGAVDMTRDEFEERITEESARILLEGFEHFLSYLMKKKRGEPIASFQLPPE